MVESIILLLVVIGVLALSNCFTTVSYAHGYVESPPARAFRYSSRFPGQTLNWTQRVEMIGSAADDPMSLGRHHNNGWPHTPQSPSDGHLASADCVHGCPQIDRQTSTLWQKTNLSTGWNEFTWFYTVWHETANWQFFITKQGWNQNAPLSREAFDLTPIYSQTLTGSQASRQRSNHQVFIPTDRSGYHVIYAVWTTTPGQNNETFYNVIDVNIIGGGNTENGGNAGGGGTGGTTPPQPEVNIPIFDNQTLNLATAINGTSVIQPHNNEIVLWAPTHEKNQAWHFILDHSNNVYTVQNVADGRYLTETNNTLTLTNQVSNQSRWRIMASQNQTYQLLNAATGRSLDVEGGNHTANGTRVITWSSTGNPNQRWHFNTAHIPEIPVIPEIPDHGSGSETALTPPANLRITGQTETTLSLAWDAITDVPYLKGYDIFRNGVKIAEVASDVHTFTDYGLTSGTSYSYTVRAHAASHLSNEAAGTTDSTPVIAPELTPPTHLSVTATTLTLNWQAPTNTQGLAGYRIFRNQIKVGEVGPYTTSFVDTGLMPNTAYTYAVEAFDQFGNEARSQTITASTTTH